MKLTFEKPIGLCSIYKNTISTTFLDSRFKGFEMAAVVRFYKNSNSEPSSIYNKD